MSSTEDELEGLDLGAIDYISKPFIPRLLLKRVELHIAIQAQRLHLEEQAKKLEAQGEELKKLNEELKKIAAGKIAEAE
jgi:DNA-binding response OmpR family regulator